MLILRGVLLPGAPDFVTLFLIIRHLQLYRILNFNENYVWITCRLRVKFYAKFVEYEKTFSDRGYGFVVEWK